MPYTPTHPGEVLQEQLEELGMTAADLGRVIKVPHNRVRSIIRGQRAVTADTALRLGKAFGTSAQLWLGLQQNYDLRTTEKAQRRLIARIKPVIATSIPSGQH